MGKRLFIIVRIVFARQRAKPRRAADDRLIDLLPERFRPHEGLVVKPRPQKRRRQIVQRQHIEPQRRPAILRPRHQPLGQLGGGGPQIGFLRAAQSHRHQRVRLLAACAQNPARTVILERPPDQPHVIGQQGRGQRIPLNTLIRPPVKGEIDPLFQVDQSGACDPHAPAPFTLEASLTPNTSCVAVSRRTTSQDEQPVS